MELLDRYLHAVGFWLPRNERQDIVRELSEDIQSQIDEEEAARGRPLGEDDVEAILRRYGHPMLVAGKYLPRRCVVGPTLFPAYVFVLKLFAFCYVVPWLAVWALMLVLVPSYRSSHPGLDVLVTLRSLWLIALHGFAFVTIAFALIERSQAKSTVLERWRARGLPAPADVDRTSRASSVAGIGATLVFALWWADVASLPGSGEVRAAASLRHFYWPVLLLLLAGVPVGIVDTLRPVWTRERAAMHLVVDGAWLIVASLLLVSGPWLELAANVAAGQIAAASRWINLSVLVTLVVVASVALLCVVQDVRRILGKAPLRHRSVRFLAGE